MKVFALGQVLSIATGHLMCSMNEVREILNFLHDDNLYTHQLPRASDDARPWLRESLPWLEDITCNEVTRGNWLDRLKRYEAKYGALHSLEPIPHNEELKRHPVAELADMVGKDRAIIVDPGEGRQE